MKWCVYGDCNWWGYAKIVEKSSNVVYLLYSEKQHYPPEVWWDKPVYVKKFDSLFHAVKFYCDSEDVDLDEELEQAKYKFPSDFVR